MSLLLCHECYSWTEPFDGRAVKRRDLLWLGHVARNRPNLLLGSAQALGHARDFVRRSGADHNLRAFPSQKLRDRSPDTSSTAGNDGCFSFENHARTLEGRRRLVKTRTLSRLPAFAR